MDYPSGSDDEDLDFVWEQTEETEENDHVIDSDMELSSSDSDVSSVSGNVQEDCGRYCYRLHASVPAASAFQRATPPAHDSTGAFHAASSSGC